MMKINHIDKNHVWHPFTQEKTSPDNICITKGKGAYLYTDTGRKITDYVSSWWVTNHGHAHPYVCDAISKQASELEHVIFSNFTHEPACTLAKRLVEKLPNDLNRVFFSDNGSTAIEVALKIAHQYFKNLGHSKNRIITLEGAYHGDTVGAMAAGRSSNFFEAWNEWLFDVDVIPCPHTHIDDTNIHTKEQNALSVLDKILEQHQDDVCCLILEPLIQGAGGMRMIRPEFVNEICTRIRTAGGLIIFDEVMTGFGRTGTMFACEQTITPDLICLSKGLTAGFLPMSVTVVQDKIYNAFLDDSISMAFLHGHSYTANPIGCAAALASLDLFENNHTMNAISRIEKHHKSVGFKMLSRSQYLKKIRILGTIIAVDIDVDDGGYASSIGTHLKQFFYNNNALIRPLGNVVYLLPPFCITNDELTRGYELIIHAAETLKNKVTHP